MVDDIFKDDERFGNIPKKEDEGLSKGISHLTSGIKNIFVGFFQIFSKKIPMNLFFLIMIMLAVFYGTQLIKKPEITGSVIQNFSCPEIKCDKINQTCPEEEYVCPELDCSGCPQENKSIETKNIIYYMCPSGTIVNDTKDCSKYPVNLTSQDNSIANNAILSLDWINYTIRGNDTYSINRMNITIVNLGNEPILPKVEIKIYEKWASEVAKELPLRTIKFDDLLKFNEVVSISEPMILDFEGLPKTVRLEVFDTIPDPDKSLATVTKEIKAMTLS